jgi:hypothetical protein
MVGSTWSGNRGSMSIQCGKYHKVCVACGCEDRNRVKQK